MMAVMPRVMPCVMPRMMPCVGRWSGEARQGHQEEKGAERQEEANLCCLHENRSFVEVVAEV